MTFPVLRKIESIGWAVLALAGLGSLLVLPWAWTIAIGLGGVLALGNFRCIDLYFARVLPRTGPRPRWWVHALYAARFLGLIGAVAAGVAWGKLPVVGIVLGLSVLFVAIAIYGVAALTGERA